MKYLLTFFQLIGFLIIDLLLYVYYLKWNAYLTSWGYAFLKQKNGYVRMANNSEKNYKKTYKNKYSAIFS